MDAHLHRHALVWLALFLVPSHALAQQGSAEIRGRVVDQQQAALPGVTVTVTNQDTGNFRDVVSGSDGTWFVPALPPGRYQITAQLSGFKKFIRRDLALAVGNQLAIDKTVDVTADLINVTNHANFVSPVTSLNQSDRRSTNFLLLTTLYGGGQPRQAQVGLRLGF